MHLPEYGFSGSTRGSRSGIPGAFICTPFVVIDKPIFLTLGIRNVVVVSTVRDILASGVSI